MKIYDLDSLKGYHHDITEYMPICEIDFTPKIYDVFHVDDEYSVVCRINLKTNSVGVRKIDYDPEREDFETHEHEFTCPYCGYIDFDAFELSDEGETKCGTCGAVLVYERQITTSYSVTGKKPPNVLEV